MTKDNARTWLTLSRRFLTLAADRFLLVAFQLPLPAGEAWFTVSLADEWFGMVAIIRTIQCEIAYPPTYWSASGHFVVL